MKPSIPAVTLAFVLALHGLAAFAQYPARPIRVIVPLPAGGPSDAAARSLGQVLTKSLGQPIVIDNRPGAGGALAAQAILAAAADGHTLLWANASMVALPLVQKSPPFQSIAEFTPVSLIGRFVYAVFVHPNVPARSVAELIEYTRAHPGKAGFATGTLGEYLTTAQFLKATGIEMFRVPYKGGAQAMPDLLAGRVHMFITPIQLGIQHARDGKLRPLAAVHQRRSALAPELPTLDELGVKDVSSPTWQALFAPLKTAPSVVAKLSGEITRALSDPGLNARFGEQAIAIEGAGPEVLATVAAQDFASWRTFVREYDIPKE